MWNRQIIKQKVIESADKYGFNNKQQINQLHRVLLKCEEQEVFAGLIEVFKEDNGNACNRQEVAGRLLFTLNPTAKFDLDKEITSCLAYFDLSIEHLPFYFVKQFGLKEVSKVIEGVSKNTLTDREKESLATFRFWLKNYAEWTETNV